MFLSNLFYCVRYEIVESGFAARADRYGLWVNFDNEVLATRDSLSVEPLTLLTRVGGIIGVGKELLWVVISFITLTVTLRTYVYQT